MRNWAIGTCALALTVAGCSASEDAAYEDSPRGMISQIETTTDAPENSFGFMEAMATSPDPFGADAPSARLSVARTGEPDGEAEQSEVPADQAESQIAYSYGFGFRISSDEIAALQQAHIGLCDELGPSCRVLFVSQANPDGYDGYGELKLQVEAKQAATFGDALSGPADQFGGDLISSVRDGEDLSEQIIDSEARLASRLILRDKLTDILRSNRGSVDELVKAETAVAKVNEEIDATRTKLQEFRNRIRYSSVRVEYEPRFGESQIGFSRPIVTAFRSVGSTLGMTVATIIYGITMLIPVVALLLAVRWTLHRFGLRMRFWRKHEE